MNKLISIVIPAYNAENYLDRCIKSVLNQTYTNFELIIIDDGSQDNTYINCKKYMTDLRVRVWTQKNAGQGEARNVGISKSKGEYITFIDVDDYIDKNFLKYLVAPLNEKKYDIIYCDYYKVYKDRSEYIFANEKKLKSIKKSMIVSAPSPCAKIFNIKLFRNNFFPKIIYEDLALIPYLFAISNNIKYIDSALYYYIQTNTSTVRGKKFNEKRLDIFKAVEYLLYKFNKKEILNLYNQEIEYLLLKHFVFYGVLRMIRYKKFLCMTIKTRNLIIKNFSKWKENIYYEKEDKYFKTQVKNIMNLKFFSIIFSAVLFKYRKKEKS